MKRLAIIAAAGLAMAAAANPVAMWFHFGDAAVPALPVTDGLELWLDAADNATVLNSSSNPASGGEAVAIWADKSGNARNATQATAGSRPVRIAAAQNGRDVVRHVADFMSIPNSTAAFAFLHKAGNSTIYLTIKAGTNDNPNTAYNVLVTGAAALQHGFFVFFDDTAASSRNNLFGAAINRNNAARTALINTDNDVWTPNQYSVLRVRLSPDNATAANRIKFSFNGGAEGGGNTLTNAPSTSDASANLFIGADNAGAGPFVGDLCEILIYNRDLTSGEQASVQAYLKTKWGTP
jgi:hypothetical protein